MSEKVVVLLSSYNGEKYLREQIDSILNQTNVLVQLIVRDDGSKDNTINILREYKGLGFLDYYTGKNLGPIWSFMDLIYNAPKCEYYALADQDDVWNSRKLETAITYLNDKSPALYYHAMDVVDENLNSYDYYYRDEKYSKSLEYSCMYGDEIAGCTMVFNYKLLECIKKYKPSFLTMHDGWIHRVCLCVHGKIYCDQTPLIQYRQHSSNTVGMKKRTFNDKIMMIVNKNPKFSRLALEMLKGYKKNLYMSEEDFLIRASNYKSLKNRFYLLGKAVKSKVPMKLRINLIIKLLINGY